jgi:hypothetical protein
MQHDQGFTGSHWTLPLGDYSLRIALSAARGTIKLTMMQHVLTFLAVSMAIAIRRYYTTRIAQWRRFVAFIKATKRHHQTSTCSNIKGTLQLRCFGHFIVKRAPVDMLAPNNNMGMTYHTNEKHLTIFLEYFFGVVKLAIN